MIYCFLYLYCRIKLKLIGDSEMCPLRRSISVNDCRVLMWLHSAAGLDGLDGPLWPHSHAWLLVLAADRGTQFSST